MRNDQPGRRRGLRHSLPRSQWSGSTRRRCFPGAHRYVSDIIRSTKLKLACDGETKAEIVLPLSVAEDRTIGVLDLDSTVLATFDEDDRAGLQGVVDILARSSDWSSFT